MLKTAAILVAAVAALGAAPRTAYAQTNLVTCESLNGRQQLCGADTRAGVRLVNQLSGSSCVEGRTWGTTRNAIWVTSGCRAQFQVGTSNTRYSRRYDNRYNNGYNDNGVGYTVPNGARLCQQAAAQQFGIRRSSIQAWVANGSRNNPRYEWRGGGREGTCRFDRNGNVIVRMSR
jgi:hypothetical protein